MPEKSLHPYRPLIIIAAASWIIYIFLFEGFIMGFIVTALVLIVASTTDD